MCVCVTKDLDQSAMTSFLFLILAGFCPILSLFFFHLAPFSFPPLLSRWELTNHIHDLLADLWIASFEVGLTASNLTCPLSLFLSFRASDVHRVMYSLPLGA